jgi:predicted transcriptional regulator
METQNFTMRLPKDLIRKAKILAARRDTSVSALLAGQLEALVKHDLEYETAWARWRELVQTLRLSNKGRPYPRRDEAHER